MAQRLSHLAAWWHLLSLDAPTVAALWAWFFAHAMHLRFLPLQTLPLALATWLLYAGDRILDGLHPGQGEQLRERHYFHARHRTAFLAIGSLLLALLAWAVATRMRPEALRDNLLIGLGTLLYLLAVHRRNPPRLPKEFAVAIIFAAATAVPAWSRIAIRPGKEQLAPAVLLFAGLCWVNCVGIEKWEAGNVHITTRWAGLHLRGIVTIIALFSLAAAWLAPSRGLMAVYLAALLSSGLLFALDARSHHFSPLSLRIAADAALLTPLAFLPLAVNFDLVARPYRWLEYFSFGPLLQRCRDAQLARLTGARRALVLGDGDGRFLVRLLAINPTLTADVVDSSRCMLRLLEKRIPVSRVCLHHADALTWQPIGAYDLIVSHFFLDCFFPRQLEQLCDRVLPHALPEAQWVISEFAMPANIWAAPLAGILIALLYKIFGRLTGLSVRTLPDYATVLSSRGLQLKHDRRYLAGLLCSQVWTFPSQLQISPLREAVL